MKNQGPRRREKAVALRQRSLPAQVRSAKSISYPAVADSVDLPDLTFHKNKDEDAFIVLTTAEQQSCFERNATISNRTKTLDDSRLMTLLAPMWPEGADSDITVNIIARRATLLKIKQDGMNVVVDAHWNLFIPYCYQIKELPIAHSEILDIFAGAVFTYVIVAAKHSRAAKTELKSLVIEAYRAQPQLLLASLDIFNKPNVYHIRPKRIWLYTISAVNDEHRLEIDAFAAATAPLVRPEFLEKVTGFVHNVVKGYAFRYADYLWTQQYRISFRTQPGVNMAVREGNDIVINTHPLIDQTDWKPTLYLSLGYAVMLAVLQSSGGDGKKENSYLAMMKTWNRYLSFDESIEQQSVRDLCDLPQFTGERQRRKLLEYMTSTEGRELVDDVITLMDYSAKERFVERLHGSGGSQYANRTGVNYEQLWDTVRNLNTTLMRNNISHAQLIEILRNDNIDHVQVADLLLTGRLDNRSVVDVSEWLLLRTLIYDLINAPKVFRNDYKMLLKVLTKVNKSLIVYIWTLILDNDVRCELVNAYISRLITDIFVFDRVKIYEIVADPVECLEAEAVTGYLLNWAGLSLEEWRSIIGGALSRLPRRVVRHLSVQTTGEVDQLIRAMTIRASGLIGFYLHQAYRWGSAQDEVTERIRSRFPELLKRAQKAVLPQKTVMGGAMLLVILAQIISDERDGFARNIAITKEDRQIVLGLIKQCVDWDQKHFVMMVGGIAAGYTGSIDGWIFQRFDTLLGRYGGGDRVVLRSVVQFDVEILIERTLITAKAGEESALLNKIQLLRLDVDPVVSNQANKSLGEIASRHGIQSPEVALKRKDIRELILDLSRRMNA
jgi:hypothetical protein